MINYITNAQNGLKTALNNVTRPFRFSGLHPPNEQKPPRQQHDKSEGAHNSLNGWTEHTEKRPHAGELLELPLAGELPELPNELKNARRAHELAKNH